jgi:hypothetical protein
LKTQQGWRLVTITKEQNSLGTINEQTRGKEQNKNEHQKPNTNTIYSRTINKKYIK